MHPEDADAYPEEGAPRKRRRRRRRKPTAAPPGEGAPSHPDEPEAAAFLEPPPLDPETDDEPASPRKPRKKRARRRARKPEAPEGDAPPEVTSPTGSAPVEDDDEAADAAAVATASQSPTSKAKPARKRAPRKKASRKKAARKQRAARAPADEPDAPEPADEDAAAATASEVDDSGGGGEEQPTRKKRARRTRKRARRRRSAETAGGLGAEPDIEPPPPPGSAEAAAFAAEAGAEAPAPDDAAPKPKGRRKRPARGERGRGEKGRSEKARGESSREKERDKRKRGRGKDGERTKRRDGRRSEGRKSEGGRGDRRQRDPRAIEIVPRAPTAEDLAREKVLLVNATDREEARIALLVDGVLEEVYIEAASSERSSAGNIYRGRVQNVERGIGAAFVDLGRGVTGFLHASDLPVKEEEDDAGGDVTERLQPGDEVIVQITRDSIGRKGPALTGRISFAGRYLVLMPFTARSGISRRIPQGPERERVRKLVRKLEVPEGMGVIVRTASETTDLAALEADLNHLLKEWEFIKRKAAEPGQPGVLRGESDLAERSVRDIMPSDVTRIVVDRDDIAGRIHRLLRVWYPSAAAAADEAAHVAVRTTAAAMDAPLGEIESGSVAAVSAPRAETTTETETESVDEPTAERMEASDPDALTDPDPDPDADSDADSDSGARPTADGPDSEGDAEVNGAKRDDPIQGLESDVDVDLDVDVDVDADAGDDIDEAIDAEEDIDDVEDVDDDDADADEEDASAEEEGAEPAESHAERLARLTHLARAMPEVELHTETLPLFHKYGAETQLEDAFRRSTRLPAGGSIVIDPTEALVAVDVNSGRLTDETDPEATALVTNLEAVQEAARQLRLRDLGGLVVIDFIDMRDRKSRKKVEMALKDALSGDRARIRMGRMGPFGLIVLSRQRIRQALSRVTHDPCTDCAGTGFRRQISGLGLRVLREMQARVARSRGRGGLGVRAPQEVVNWIKKNRTGVIKQLRKACSGPITLEADARLAVDGWAMKGLPPEGGGDEGE